MMTNGKIAVAVVGGYLLGRTKKAKLAVGLGMLLAGKKITLDPAQLKKSLAQAPLLSGLNSEVRKELADATRQAATKAVSDRVSGLADSLHERTALLRGEGGGEDEEAEAEDERDRDEDEEPATDEDSAADEDSAERADDETESGPRRKPKPPKPPREATAKAPTGPAKKTAASGSGRAKKAAAKKAPAKKTAAKKTARTAGGRNG
ncbi:hypothetical protein JBE04_05170 [Streptomyces sp. PRKS01-29]|nr:hypothetical protein [Streptomyces sabulosicollis]MBI0293901.1 hypothetical protein [Streptomyces sabulosicollis]